MFCFSCGVENKGWVVFCTGCGKPVRTRSLTPRAHIPNVETPKRGSLRLARVALLALPCALITLFLACGHESRSHMRQPQRVAQQPAHLDSTPTLRVNIPKPFPPLHILTSSSLPASLRGFALGMDFADAVRLNPQLKNLAGGAPSLNSNGYAVACHKDSQGILVTVTFAAGRVIDINAELSPINSGYAEEIESTTFKELGAPSKEMDERGRSYPSRRWVWIDGDVRIAFENRASAGGGQTVSAELVDYPVFLHGLEDPSAFDDKKQQQLLIQQTEQEWGGEPKPSPYLSVSLPNEMEGLRLGESASQMSVALHGAAMRTSTDETFSGSYRFSNGNELRFSFVHNNLESICEDRLDITPAHFDEFHKSLSSKYGPPNIGNPLLGTTGWTDGKVNFYYLVNKSQQSPDPFMVVCIEDKQLKREDTSKTDAEVNSVFPPDYKTTPLDHSLFLSQDLRHYH